MANLSISDLAKQTKADLDETVRQFVVNLGNSCINKSPIGMPETWSPPGTDPSYEPGHFIHNWQHGLNSMPENEILGMDLTGNSSVNRIKESVFANPAAGVHFIANNTKYAAKLENGHSHLQAPEGMVAITVLEADMHLRRAIASVK